MHFDKVYNDVQHLCPEKWFAARWGFMEAVGRRHSIVFIWILCRVRDTISSWRLCRDRGIRWAAACFFISYQATWSGMWEWVSFLHREFWATNCMYPWPWMHKSYGLPTSSWSILQICRLTSQQRSLVWNSANKFKILLCKFTTIQVPWEACDIHVWQWMEHSAHRIRHCRRRWCSIVDVTSTHEKPRIPIRTYSRESLFVLCTYWNEKKGLEDSHEYSSHSWFVYKVLHGTWAKFISKLHKSRVSSHNTITLSTARLLWNKMFQGEEEALVTGDYWQVDGLRRELIRHHKDKRMNLHEMNRSDKTPIPKDQLLDARETHMEYQKSKKKILHKDNWREEKKRFSEQSDEHWKGKTIYKIKEDYVIPDDVIKSDLDRAKPFRGNIDDLFHPESASSAPSGVQKKPGPLQKEAGKPISRGTSLKKIEVGPPAAKRHVGKQKPKVVDDSQGGSSRKKVVVSYPRLDEEDELDKRARELGFNWRWTRWTSGHWIQIFCTCSCSW